MGIWYVWWLCEVNILTLKVGSKYSHEYVNKLFFNLNKNSNTKFNFYCYTEDASKLASGIVV